MRKKVWILVIVILFMFSLRNISVASAVGICGHPALEREKAGTTAVYTQDVSSQHCYHKYNIYHVHCSTCGYDEYITGAAYLTVYHHYSRNIIEETDAYIRYYNYCENEGCNCSYFSTESKNIYDLRNTEYGISQGAH